MADSESVGNAPTLSLDSVRAQFPALATKTFLDAACVSLTPQACVEAIDNFLETALLCPERSSTLHHIAMDDLRSQARPEIARLLHCAEDEVALLESTTQGLSIATDAIPLQAGDRVVLSDLEYLQVAVPWCQKRDQIGIGIDVVPHRDGRVLVDDIAAAMGPTTVAVAVSSVQWTNGFRCDLEALGSLCRERGVWLVVDAIQQLGAMPIDVTRTPVDLLACGGHKWLNAPFGAGFLYIRREAMARLRPLAAGYLSMETPEGGWGSYFSSPSTVPVRDYTFVDTARRYEVGGTANYPGSIGLAASLRMINALGPGEIASHIIGLTDHLIGGPPLAGRRRRNPARPPPPVRDRLVLRGCCRREHRADGAPARRRDPRLGPLHLPRRRGTRVVPLLQLGGRRRPAPDVDGCLLVASLTARRVPLSGDGIPLGADTRVPAERIRHRAHEPPRRAADPVTIDNDPSRLAAAVAEAGPSRHMVAEANYGWVRR